MSEGDETNSRRPADRRERVRRPARDAVRGRLRAHDPFELIRWLALSQPDPRKAMAELVQNSLDASAGKIRVTRLRERGLPCLSVLDDGRGVIPEMDRPDALRYIATHIGHSRKRSLSPKERLALMTQGQYGIGLLGFWSLGQMLEMRTFVPGQRPHRLVLYRDRPDYLIEPLRGRLPIDECRTEVVVAGLHRDASSVLAGRRAADFLASELRGQLLSREVSLLVHDRMSRGRAQKVIHVRPPRFLGERIDGLSSLEVPGYPPARLEIHLSGSAGDDGEPGGLALYASGTLVCGGFGELASLGLDHSPWTDPRLSGLIDFPALSIAPGSRRGVVPDEASAAFARALASLEPVLSGVVESLDRRRSEELDRTMIRDLQRAFRDFYRHRPRFAMLPISTEKETGGEADAAGPASGSQGEPEGRIQPMEDESFDQPITAPSPEDLLPPGPLAEVRLTPSPVRIRCGSLRRVRAAAVDAHGRLVEDPVTFEWRLAGPIGTFTEIAGSPGRILFTSSDHPGQGTITVLARTADREVTREATVDVLEGSAFRSSDEGIPEPELVDLPGAAWRSRMSDGRWQVNVGHREYRVIADRPSLKLRYLAMLFAKEIVLRSSQDPRLEKPLEQLVEVAAYADVNLAGERTRRRAPHSPASSPPDGNRDEPPGAPDSE